MARQRIWRSGYAPIRIFERITPTGSKAAGGENPVEEQGWTVARRSSSREASRGPNETESWTWIPHQSIRVENVFGSPAEDHQREGRIGAEHDREFAGSRRNACPKNVRATVFAPVDAR